MSDIPFLFRARQNLWSGSRDEKWQVAPATENGSPKKWFHNPYLCWGMLGVHIICVHVSLVQTEQEYIPAHESLVLALQTSMRANINFKGFYTGSVPFGLWGKFGKAWHSNLLGLVVWDNNSISCWDSCTIAFTMSFRLMAPCHWDPSLQRPLLTMHTAQGRPQQCVSLWSGEENHTFA